VDSVLSETGDVVPRHGFTVWLSVAVWASCFSGVLDDSFAGLQFNLESLPALLASQCPYPPVHSFIVPPRVRAVEYARIRSKCQRELCNVRKTTNKVVYLLPSRDFCLLTFSRAFWISRISFSCFSESFWTVLIACDYFLTAALLPSAFGHDTISGLVSQVCC
jgi:hypothetical protein